MFQVNKFFQDNYSLFAGHIEVGESISKAADWKEIRDIIAKDSRGDKISLVFPIFSVFLSKVYIHSYYVFLFCNDQLRSN